MCIDILRPMKTLVQRAHRSVWLLAVLALTLAPEFAQAQQARRITFNEAIQIALQQNYALKVSANAVEQQSINVSRQWWNFWPNLNFSAGFSQNRGRAFIQDLGQIFTATTNGFNSSFSANVNVFNGFADVASLQQARYQRDARDLDFERQRQSVVFNVMSQYLDLIARREEVLIQEENLAAQQQLLTQIEEFVRVSIRPMSDLFQQQASTANAEATLLNAQRFAQLSEVALIQILQIDPLGTYEFAVPDLDDATLVAEQYNLNEMFQSAFDRRLDLQASELDIDAAAQGIRIARSNYWPSISFGASTSLRYSDSREADFSTQFFDERNTNLGFSLGLPIFDRFATRNTVQQARLQLQNAQLALENEQQNVALQVRQAYLDYLTDEKRLDVTEKQVRAAEQALEAEQERYNVGASTLVELTQARASFVQASSARAEARYTFLFRKRLIEYYIGVLDPTQTLFE